MGLIMEPSLTMYISLVATSGVFTIFLCSYAYIRRAVMPGASLFMLYTIAQAVYIFAVAFETASTSITEIMRWTVVQYTGMATAPVLGLIVVLNYLGKTVSRKTALSMLVVPTISIVMIATNDYHHLFYRSFVFRTDTTLPLTEITIGQFYILHGVYTFGCMLAGGVLLLRRWRSTKKAYRLQLITMLTGQLLPSVGAFVYLMGMVPYDLDPVPVILCLTSGMYIWAIVSARMLTVVPIAKESIFESMGEGVVVLDKMDKLIDFNGAASRMLPGLSTAFIGISLDEAWHRMTGAPFPVERLAEDAMDELVWRTDANETLYYQARFSVVRGRFGETIGSLLMLIDVTESRRLQDQLQQLAYHDGLTKLLNRTAFIQRSKTLLQEAQDSETPAAIILFDIDHFKRINDTYGHETGDFAIRHLVTVLKRELPPETLFARYGGEEFVVYVPDCTEAEARATAERLRAALASSPLTLQNGENLTITSSFGVAQTAADGSEQKLQALLRDADQALYEAKREGRNRVALYGAAVRA